MASTPQSGFYSTPAFEIFRRGMVVQTIKQFRGINLYQTESSLGPDWALDCMNVIVGSDGGLHKMRYPVQLTQNGWNTTATRFVDFQQGNGTRQLVMFGPNNIQYVPPDFSAAPTLISADPANAGKWRSAQINNIMFAGNGVLMKKWTGANWWNWGVAPAGAAVQYVGTVAGNLSPLTGYEWAIAFKNSVTGDVSVASPATQQLGGGSANVSFNLQGYLPADPQIDTIIVYRTLDGGGNLYRVAEIDIATMTVTFNAATFFFNGSSIAWTDNTPDGNLDLTTQASYINFPPPVGNIIVTGQNRIFIAGIVGDPQAVAYSGYEQIFNGLAPACFPPYNRLRLPMGAESVAGLGVLETGVVAFSNTGRLYTLRGQVEDITTSSPVNFTQYLIAYDWPTGCLNHDTIAATPYGLIFLAGDKTLQIFQFPGPPTDISGPVYPILRAITPGTESQCVGTVFNWLERDWYALTCCINGAMVPNRIIFWSLAPSSGDVEIFISDISASFIGTITTPLLQRELAICSQGQIYQLPVSSDTVGGITRDLTIIPPTDNKLNAWWRSGYAGNDTPQQSRMFKHCRLATDVDATAFDLDLRFVDDEDYTFLNPLLLHRVIKDPSGKFSPGRRSKRMSVQINFPADDVSANVIEMQIAVIPTSYR